LLTQACGFTESFKQKNPKADYDSDHDAENVDGEDSSGEEEEDDGEEEYDELDEESEGFGESEERGYGNAPGTSMKEEDACFDDTMHKTQERRERKPSAGCSSRIGSHLLAPASSTRAEARAASDRPPARRASISLSFIGGTLSNVNSKSPHSEPQQRGAAAPPTAAASSGGGGRRPRSASASSHPCKGGADYTSTLNLDLSPEATAYFRERYEAEEGLNLSTTTPASAGGKGVWGVLPPAMAGLVNTEGRVGVYRREDRRFIVERYLARRQKRLWNKVVRLVCVPLLLLLLSTV